MKHSLGLTTRKIALVATFSALYYVLSFLPGIKTALIGVSGANVTIQIEAFMSSIFGLILGPYLGALTAFMGAFLAWLLPPGSPSPTSAVFLPAPMINAFIVGLIYTKRWKIAFGTLAAVISAFWFLPPTQPWDQYFNIGFYAMWDKIVALALIAPAAMLMNRVTEKPVKILDNDKTKIGRKIDLALILSVIAAVFILMNAWMTYSEGKVIRFQYVIFGTTFDLRFGFKELIQLTASYGYVWLLLGIGILICAALLYLKPEKRFVWSASIFALSCVSAVIGGGFFVGLFVGVLGGIFGILKRMFTLPRISLFGDAFLYFLLAFIGNEADNALGNDIFAAPMIYDRIFQFPLDVMRLSFMVAPFFYFAIRLFQAAITTLIATPLLRTLKSAGFGIAQLPEAASRKIEKIS